MPNNCCEFIFFTLVFVAVTAQIYCYRNFLYILSLFSVRENLFPFSDETLHFSSFMKKTSSSSQRGVSLLQRKRYQADTYADSLCRSGTYKYVAVSKKGA